ncbi:Propane 2-monooxygenase, hydroxylase component small subunit [Paraconexibacter sp. AEG42_29]|uniref:propane 2-monooxygenase n=1 Tax=Paraconexibacter sp. AEG42_29 TaxID=2997339 RepID=A0AAU7AQT6_9ACTN
MTPPPVKQIKDGTGARSDDNERTFNYFTPVKRRASVYEDVTVDTQPSIHRHVDRGWQLSFDGVHGVWSDDSTRLEVADWYDFRDPAGWWERTFYQVGSQSERGIDSAVRQANVDGLFADFDPAWVEFLRVNLQVPAFVQHGLWLAVAATGRDTLSDTLTHAVVMQAGLKQRFAQSIVLYALDLEPHFGEFPMDTARERWMEHPAWQPTRRFVEKLRTIVDWGESIVAINLCFEPLVGVLISRELGMRAASANGDTVTPTIGRVAQLEWQWINEWTADFAKLVLGDAEHGERNRELVAGWIDDWMPLALEAVQALAGMVDELPVAIDFEASWERTLRDAQTIWAAAGVADLVSVPTQVPA